MSTSAGSSSTRCGRTRERILALQPDERLQLYGQYEPVASATEQLPVDPDLEGLEEFRRQHPAGFGRWRVLDKAGNVSVEFRPDRD